MRTIALLMGMLLAGGCDSTPSAGLGADELRLSAFAEIDDKGELDLVAILTTDNQALLEETYVDLAPGDRLIARVGREAVVMEREWIYVLNMVQYRVSFPSIDTRLPTKLRIDLKRDGDDDVLGSEVVVPPAFELISAPESFSRAQDLVLEWESSPADDSRVELSGPCLDARFDLPGNPGAIEISPVWLHVTPGTAATATCTVSATVRVQNSAPAARGFGRGGILQATQSRTTTLLSMP